MKKEREINNKCLRDEANFISRINFLWIIPLFNLGFEKSIDYSELGDFCTEDEPENAAKLLQR